MGRSLRASALALVAARALWACTGLKADGGEDSGAPVPDASLEASGDDARPPRIDAPEASADTFAPDAARDASEAATDARPDAPETGSDASDAADAAADSREAASFPPSAIGVYEPKFGQWVVDRNGNHVEDPTELDASSNYWFGGNAPVNATPLTGAFKLCADSRLCSEIAIFAPENVDASRSIFTIDENQNGTWDQGTDLSVWISGGHEQGVVGVWAPSQVRSAIGAFNDATGTWRLDANANNTLDTTAQGDLVYVGFGASGDIAVVGDWTGSGLTRIGVVRAGTFMLDANGNGKWDGVAGGDLSRTFGSATALPVIGDWNGDGVDDVGVYEAGTWSVDLNGNGTWDGPAGGDATYNFGAANRVPITGHWF